MWISKEKYESMERKLELLERDNKSLWSKLNDVLAKHSRLLDHLGLNEWTEPEKREPEKTTLITKRLYNRRMREKQKEQPQYNIQQQLLLHSAQQQAGNTWHNLFGGNALSGSGGRY